MSKNTEILDLLKALSIDVKDMKAKQTAMDARIADIQEENTSSVASVDKMYKTLNAKFDVFKNLEAQSRETVQQAATSRKVTRPVFFKKLFLEEREKHLNILYTQEEIDEAFKAKDVVAKKKDAEKVARVSTILYTTHIKGNKPEGRANAFESLYDQRTATN